MATVYQKARQQFFNLEPEQSIMVVMPSGELMKFRDSIYKLTKRYKAYNKMYKTRLINPNKLKIWRIK